MFGVLIVVGATLDQRECAIKNNQFFNSNDQKN